VFDSALSGVNVERGASLFGDGTSFLVVGVVGRVGVGKSTLASLLLARADFAVRSVQDQLAARHCTVGVDVAVSADRVIVLDMQPMLCASLPPAAAAIEPALLAWLLAVCHLVVVVSGSASFGSFAPLPDDAAARLDAPPAPPTPLVAAAAKPTAKGAAAHHQHQHHHHAQRAAADDGSWRAARGGAIESVSFGAGHAGGTWPAMRAALMLRRGMPCVSVLDKLAPAAPIDIAKHDAERCASAVFAFTKLPSRTLEDWRLARHTHGRDVVANAIALSFANTELLLPRSAADDDEQRRLVFGSDHHHYHHQIDAADAAATAPGAPYVMLPRRPQRADDGGWRAFDEAAEVFRTTVLSAPRRKFVRADLTERQWWRNAATAWQLLSTSSKATQEFAKVCSSLGQTL
jgi:hypothetical protein